MFKLAYGAGHNAFTSNGIPESIDPENTREWVLNDRIARYFAQAAGEYEGLELLRVDDPAGVAPVDLSQRCKAANDWGADFFLSIHHNGGINGGSGGGLVAFSYRGAKQGAIYRDAIYKACMEYGGIRGDRYAPCQEAGFYVLKYTHMPAVLMEYGFMDSVSDAPIILTEEYAKAMAYATMEAIAQVAGLKKRTEALPVTTLPQLGQGDRGKTVKAVQTLLGAEGYSLENFGADGIFGQETGVVLRAFQKANALAASGVTDTPTWVALLGL